MTGASITVDDAAVLAALRSLTTGVQRLRPTLAAIGGALVTQVDLGFREQTDPWGAPWPALSATTQARRRSGRGSGANQILRDTGRLANSFSYRADDRAVQVGTSVVYAGTHQFGAEKGAYGRTRRGSPIPWGDVPARPMLPIRSGVAALPAAWKDEILGIAAAQLLRSMAMH